MAFTNKTAEHIQAAVDAAFAAQNFPSAQPEPVQNVPRIWRNALRELAFMARTSGGTAGADVGLMAALMKAEALLKLPYAPIAQPEQQAPWREMIEDTKGVFDYSSPETPQTTRDVIEYVKSWLEVYEDKTAHPPAHPPAQPTKRAPLVIDQGAVEGPVGTEADVCADILKRQQLGINKYGTTVRDNPLALREWLQHAYEECLDQAVYLKRAMEEIDWRDADAEVLPVGPSL